MRRRHITLTLIAAGKNLRYMSNFVYNVPVGDLVSEIGLLMFRLHNSSPYLYVLHFTAVLKALYIYDIHNIRIRI